MKTLKHILRDTLTALLYIVITETLIIWLTSTYDALWAITIAYVSIVTVFYILGTIDWQKHRKDEMLIIAAINLYPLAITLCLFYQCVVMRYRMG